MGFMLHRLSVEPDNSPAQFEATLKGRHGHSLGPLPDDFLMKTL
jgi:hypothetical protein